MTSEELYCEIVRNPDDDGPRLAYADVVAPRDPERAEFIRLQIARARDEAVRGVQRGRPSAAEVELRARHGSRWGHFIAAYARAYLSDAPFQGYEFERGFVALLRTEPGMVADMCDKLIDMAPIPHLDLTSNGPFIPALTAPCLGKMRSLACNAVGLGNDDAIALAERGHLDRCEYLDLSGNQIGRPGVAALLANPVIRNMPVVLLTGNPGDPAELIGQDVDGRLVLEGLPPDGKEAEARYGRIPWLHLPPLGIPHRFGWRRASAQA